MTCLVPPAFLLADGQPDDRADRRRELCLGQVGATYQRLLDELRGLGLELDLLLPTSAALPRLSAWNASQLERLQLTLNELLDDASLCRELLSALRSLARGDATTFSGRSSSSLSRTVVLVRPLLSFDALNLLAQGRRLAWPSLDGDPLATSLEALALTVRLFNRLRRQGMARLADLAGLNAEQLLAIRGMGPASIQEITELLERQGLKLPFSLEDGLALPPISLPVPANSSAQPQVNPVAPVAPPLAADAAEACEWSARAIALLSGADAEDRPERALQALQALTVERFPSLRQRLEELHQLRDLLRSVDSASGPGHAQSSLPAVGAEAIQQRLLARYSELIAAGDGPTPWLLNLKSHLFRYPHAMNLLLQHLSGRSLHAIGQLMNPPLSRDRVSHQIKALERLLGLQLGTLRASCQQLISRGQSEHKAAVLQDWINARGRLPFHTDDDASLPLMDAQATALWRQVSQLSLSRRLALHEDLGLPVPEAEWDLHFRVLANNEERPGPGYWETLEPLRQCLPRFAVLFGTPGMMPKQTQLPAGVHSAVQRHGGQSAVARSLGLAYQGQLVGEHGRTYWTELRLEQLLEQTVSYCSLPVRAMPSRLQIRAFLQSGLVAEYADKSPETVYAALTRQSTLSWLQVAQRFGRI